MLLPQAQPQGFVPAQNIDFTPTRRGRSQSPSFSSGSTTTSPMTPPSTFSYSSPAFASESPYYRPTMPPSVPTSPRMQTPTFQPTTTQAPQPGTERYDFILPNADLSEGQRKYCRCLLRVQDRGRAYSPYGVCTKSVGAQVHSCSQYYDWPAMNLDMLRAYASLHKIDTSNLNSKEEVLNAIGQWKSSRGESF